MSQCMCDCQRHEEYHVELLVTIDSAAWESQPETPVPVPQA